MPKVKQPWHKGTYDTRSRKITAAARANPACTCWRCGLTVAQVRARYPKRRVHWTAGHLVDGQENGELRPECSPCNYGRGAAAGNRRRGRVRRTQLRTSQPW